MTLVFFHCYCEESGICLFTCFTTFPAIFLPKVLLQSRLAGFFLSFFTFPTRPTAVL